MEHQEAGDGEVLVQLVLQMGPFELIERRPIRPRSPLALGACDQLLEARAPARALPLRHLAAQWL